MTLKSTDRPRKPKLRSSCDQCLASKVKCLKGVPTCGRCATLGINCNYSISRRMGKPPATARKPTDRSDEPTSRPARKPKSRLESPTLNTISNDNKIELNTHISYLDELFFDPLDSMSMGWQPSSILPGPHMRSMTYSEDTSMFPYVDGTENDNASHSETAQCQDLELADPIFAFNDKYHQAMLVSSLTKDEISSQPCTDPFGVSSDKKDLRSQTPDCAGHISAAMMSLQSLQIDLDICSIKGPNGGTYSIGSIEQVLMMNNAAMECIDKILACSCSHTPHYALTLALICHKILIRYETLAKSVPTVSTPENSHQPRMDDYSAGPIIVGTYKTNAEDERRLGIQLVVNELRKVEGVLERYQEKYCAVTDADSGRKGSLYSALGSFLKSDLSRIWLMLYMTNFGEIS